MAEGTIANLVAVSTDRLALIVDPAFGGRATSLIDRMTAREWLLQGPRATDVSQNAACRGAASRGWDECFPTALSCQCTDWGIWLRDHGMLWGRPWQVVENGPRHLKVRFQSDGITFLRRLILQGAGLTAAYAVTSARSAPVPYLWSQHCALSPVEGDRITRTGQGRMKAAEVSFNWPDYPARDLSAVGQVEEGVMLKSYGLTPASTTAQVSGPKGGRRFDWVGSDVPALGIWLDYGAWPEEGPLCQVAIGPTTAAADDLAGPRA